MCGDRGTRDLHFTRLSCESVDRLRRQAIFMPLLSEVSTTGFLPCSHLWHVSSKQECTTTTREQQHRHDDNQRHGEGGGGGNGDGGGNGGDAHHVREHDGDDSGVEQQHKTRSVVFRACSWPPTSFGVKVPRELPPIRGNGGVRLE